MNALVYEGPWEMPLRQLAVPTLGPDEVLLEVKAAGICGSDIHGYTGSTGRRTPPLVMGHEVAGRVAAVGEAVSRVAVGDRVVVQPLLTCGACSNCRAGLPNICLHRTGVGMNFAGGYAEALRVPERLLYPLPEGLGWVQGTLVEPLAVALRAANLTPLALGDTAVVVGAGPIGLLTLLALKLKGAGAVVVTDVSDHRLELARKLGADVAVNVTEASALDTVRELTGGDGAHAVVEAVGTSATVQASLELVRPGGHVTWLGNAAPQVELAMQALVTREVTVRGSYGFADEFGRALALLAAGTLTPDALIELTAPLRDGPELFRALARGERAEVKVVFDLGAP